MKAQLCKIWLRIHKFITIFIIQKSQLLILRFNVKHIYGPKTVDYNLDELIVLCLVRDSELHIRSFIEHYLSLGVKHIVFLDNNSTDDTLSLIRNHENVSIFQTKLPYKRYRLVMKLYLMTRFGKNRWSLYADVDELFDYPFSDVMPLNVLLNYLNDKSYTAVVAHMLDMFSDKPLSSLKSKKDDSLKELYRYYDISNITPMGYFHRNIMSNKISIYFGGIRKTLFGSSFEYGQLLTKHPLIFLDRKIIPIYLNDHTVRNAHVADFTCVLFHYKFLSNFSEQALRIAQEEHYYLGSIEYKKIVSVLQQNPDPQIKQETSQELKSVNDLIDNRFLMVSEDYMNWVKEHSLNSITDSVL